MARHSGGTLAAKLCGLAGGFLFSIAAARLLGPNSYGVVAVAISMATVVATVALVGINGLAVRESALMKTRQAWPELRSFVRWSARVVAAASASVAILMAASAAIPGPYSKALLLGAFAVPLLAGLHLLRGIIQGSGAVVAAQLPMEAIRWIVTLAIMGLLLVDDSRIGAESVMVAVLVGLAAALLAAIGYAWRYLHGHGPVRWAEPRGRYWLVQSLPFLAIALFGIVGTEISTLLLGLLAGPNEAGLYQPIAKLAPLMLLANAAIEAALAPRIVQRWEISDKRGLQRLMGRSAVASTISTAIIAAAILLASPLILRAFGPEFTRYQRLLGWIATAQVINAATGSAALLLAMSGDNKRRIFAQAGTLAVQAGLGILLVPGMGAVGAVISLTSAIIIWSVLHWWIALRVTGIDTSLFGILHRAKDAEG
jgi:O-antigen/teichoic acid export membrane protein